MRQALKTTPGLHEHQIAPDGDWRTWLLLGGRGSGKTFAGAVWLSEAARVGGLTLALVGPALHDVREVMVEGPSGLKAVAEKSRRPRWEAGRKRLVWPNGTVAYAFSAEDADSLRGPQFHAGWADEFCAWRNPERVLSNLRFGLRLGDDPRLMVTTTPRPMAALRRLMAEAGTTVDRGPTAANEANLSPGFLKHLKALYGGTRLEAQEMEGLVVETDGALFTAADLARTRGARPVKLDRIVEWVGGGRPPPPRRARRRLRHCGGGAARAGRLCAGGPVHAGTVAGWLGAAGGADGAGVWRASAGGRGQSGRRNGAHPAGPGRVRGSDQDGACVTLEAGAGRAGGGAL